MNDILIGLLLLIVGVGLTLWGLRVFFLMLPILGFLSGFFVGATLIAGWFGDGFLSTLGSWIAGILIGLLFAVASYLYWYIGAILGAASLGALAGAGLMSLFNVDTGWIILLVAFIGAALAAIAAFILRLPIYIVIVQTALAGATAVIAGLMLVFNLIELDEFRFGATWAIVNHSWLWMILLILVGAVGIAAQLRQVAMVRFPLDRWVRADAAAKRTSAIESDAEQR